MILYLYHFHHHKQKSNSSAVIEMRSRVGTLVQRLISRSATNELAVQSALISNTSFCSSLTQDGASKLQHNLQQRQRSFSTKTNVTPAAADRRLAGRQRFYKHVGIASCDPPVGEQAASVSGNMNSSPPKEKEDNSQSSPISAGVDGTQSATGVTTSISNTSQWSTLLNPTNNNDSTSWHTVTLDNRKLKTPLGLPLSLPSLPLALAVAAEWDAQKKYLQPAQMPLMTLCCTAIDQVASNPTPHQIDVMRYLRNDTSCYWADPTEDRVLHRRQSKAWDGLHTTLSEEVLKLPSDIGPAQAVGGGDAILLSRKSSGNPQSGLPHPPILVKKAEEWVNSLDAWTLTALYSACAESKSFFIGAALIHDAMNASSSEEDDRAVRDGKWAVEAARVEEEFNIECWGLVEGGHDYDRLNCSIQMHAASFLAQMAASTNTN